MRRGDIVCILLGVGFICLMGAIAGCSSKVQRFNQPADSTGHQITDLFKGKDLEGWYKFIKGRGRNTDPKNVFTVHDRMIHITGEEYGCITTMNEFSDYRLEVEYKWGEKTFAPRIDNARDNGILLHSVGEDGAFDSTWMHSIECQIIEGGTGDFIVVGDGTDKFSITSTVAGNMQEGSHIYMPGGKAVTINKGRINWARRDTAWKDIKNFRSEMDVEKSVGEWNKLECIAKGNEIAVILNGIAINHAYDVRPAKGHIQIQSEGAEIFFRKIRLYPL